MKKILIVDDAKFMRLTLKNIVESSGKFHVIGEASNGKEAIDKYLELKPDVVTMDVTMPIMEGLEAVEIIKKLDPKANILMVSAMGQKKIVMDSIQAGAKGFLVKPFQQDKVINELEKIS
ncbi:MAG: response regulator [archaeon]